MLSIIHNIVLNDFCTSSSEPPENISADIPGSIDMILDTGPICMIVWYCSYISRSVNWPVLGVGRGRRLDSPSWIRAIISDFPSSFISFMLSTSPPKSPMPFIHGKSTTPRSTNPTFFQQMFSPRRAPNRANALLCQWKWWDCPLLPHWKHEHENIN